MPAGDPNNQVKPWLVIAWPMPTPEPFDPRATEMLGTNLHGGWNGHPDRMMKVRGG